MSKIKS